MGSSPVGVQVCSEKSHFVLANFHKMSRKKGLSPLPLAPSAGPPEGCSGLGVSPDPLTRVSPGGQGWGTGWGKCSGLPPRAPSRAAPGPFPLLRKRTQSGSVRLGTASGWVAGSPGVPLVLSLFLEETPPCPWPTGCLWSRPFRLSARGASPGPQPLLG